MSELDDRLTALRCTARDFARQARPYGLELDRDPTAIHRLLHLDAVRSLGRLQIPPEYQPDPLVVDGHRFWLTSATERVVFGMEIAWGDPGLLLAAPGAPMAGVIVAALGDRAQQERFFTTVLSEPTWAFFALTEPTGGSDATGMATRLASGPDAGSLTLTGTKRYIGNATRAGLGVVFANRGDGPLAATAVLVDSDSPGFSAAAVPTLGLRGAAVGEITLAGVPVDPDRVLGAHLSATRSGLWGWLRTFNLLRPMVAAISVGIAQAALDHLLAARPTLRAATEDLAAEIEVVRRLTLVAAQAADADPNDGMRGSAAKVRAARLAVRATRAAARGLGPGALLDHPELEKLTRDARGLDFMEGPANLQRLGIFTALSRRRPPVRR